MSSSSSEIAERLLAKAVTRASVRSSVGSATKLATKRGRCWPPTRFASSTSRVSLPSFASPSTVFSRRAAKSNSAREPSGISFRALASRNIAEGSSPLETLASDPRLRNCLVGHNIEIIDANPESGRAISQSRKPSGWNRLRASNPPTLTMRSRPARRTRRTNSSNLSANRLTSGRLEAESETCQTRLPTIYLTIPVS